MRPIDLAGNTGLAASFTWTIDSLAPDTVITASPINPSNSASASFAFSSEPDARLRCSLDGAAFADCSSPKLYSGLGDGSHTFQAKASDGVGNSGAVASFTWTIDTTAPTVAITAKPADPSNNSSPSFSFSSEAGASLECSLDATAFASCSSAQSYSGLGDGRHAFQVRATDGVGNTGAATSFTWTIDTGAPSASITASPTNPSSSSAPSFSFSSEPGATFQCALDGAAFASCSSAKSYSGLADASHTFEVRASDAAGNTGAAASFTWTIDTGPPIASITAAPTSPSNSSGATFSFTSSETPATLQCALDGAAFASCTSPVGYTGLAEGSHTFQVRASDAAGNTGAAASFTWTVDTVAPTATISAGPTNPSSSTSAAFSFTSAETSSSFACSVDGAAFTSCVSPVSYSLLADGSHTFQVQASDAAGNTGPAAGYSWTVDTSPAGVAITAGPTNPSNASDATFSFMSDEAPATFACSLDGAAFTSCPSPVSYSGLADGSHTFLVRASDGAGNTGEADSFTWTIDTGGPAVFITASPANPSSSSAADFGFSSEPSATFECALDDAVFATCSSPKGYSGLADGSHTFQVRASDAAGNAGAAASITWTVDTSGPTVSITAKPSDPSSSSSPSFGFSAEPGATFRCRLDGAVLASCDSPKSYSGVADGSHTFQVQAGDVAGNTGPVVSFTWSIDTGPPSASITASPSDPSNSSAAGFGFSSEPGASFECALDSAAFTSCSSPIGYSSLADGSHTFQVRASDSAGNTGTAAAFTWTIDTVAPNTSISATPTHPSSSTTATFSFASTEAPSSFDCSLDGAAFASCTSPVSFTGVAQGAHTFQVQARDAAGNIGAAASFAWTVDTSAPGASITASPTNPSNSANAGLAFTSTEGGSTFSCSLDGAVFATCMSPVNYSGLAQGSHTFQVKATDAAGNTGEVASFTWTVDTIAPAASISASPADPSSSSSAAFSFTSTEMPASFTCSLDGTAFGSCASPVSYASLSQGAHTFQVKASDIAGNSGAAAAFTWTIDTVAPSALITASPTNPSASSSASFSFAAEPGAAFSCSLDGAVFSTCSSATSYTGLAEGSHAFQVKATDVAGNTGAAALFTWTVDTTAPTANITASPTNPSGNASPSFSFGSESGATLACSLDGATFAACASPKSYPGLTDGSHAFEVKATDAAANTGAAASFTWTVDTIGPTASITASPTSPSTSSSASFSFNSESGATFQCSLEDAAFATCSSPKDYTDLADGSHTFQVKATDAAGNTGPAASYTWTVDTTAPTASITASPTNPSSSSAPSFSFSSESGATLACSLDGAAFATCSSPKNYVALADGSHTFQVNATDAAGNTGPAASYTWMVDTVAPTASITAKPTNPSNSASPSFSFSSESGATFQCALDGAALASCSSPKVFSGVAEDSHTFQVKATDAAGNTGAAASYTWTVDTIAPTASITASPTNPSNSASPSFSFTSESGATFQCALDGAAFASCPSSRAYTGLVDGLHTFEVKAADTAGNTGPAATYTWTVDTGAPTANITASPTNPSNGSSSSFGFGSESGATFLCSLDGATFATCTSPTSYVGVADASHTFQVKATDTAGNTGSAASYTWTIDTTAPTANIIASPTNPSNSSAPSFGFSSESGTTLECSLDGSAFATCASPQSYAGVADGSHTFQVKATDAAGNTGAAAGYTWTVDTIAPTATITASPTNPSNSSNPSFSFSAETGATFLCSLDGATFATCTSPTSYGGIADGSHTFQVKATDATGNTGTAASYIWTVDTIAPTASISASPTNPSGNASPSFSFGSELGATLACSLDGAAFATCTSPTSYAVVADGPHTFQVKASDVAGNTGATASHTWTVDTGAPTAYTTAMPSDPSNSSAPSFSFDSEAGATFQCSLDGAFSSCSSPKSYSGVADGSHTFQVKATDAAGNTGAAVSYTWTVDTIVPVASVTASPANPSTSSSPSFSFSSESGASFQCSLDDAAFATCTSPNAYAGVADGSHTFEVKATDAAGNTGPVASYTWTIDTVAPTASITASPTNPSGNATPSFSFASESGATLACSLDGAAFAACNSPTSYVGVADGSHTFQAKATDAAGNTGTAASYVWTIDTVAPSASITASPTNPSTSSSASLSFMAEPGAAFSCSLDGVAFATCTSPMSYTGLADGSHTFQVKASDVAGNAGVAASYTWTMDTIVPVATVTASPTNPSTSSSPSLSFSSESGAGFQCSLDGAAFAACTSPTSYVGVVDGSHTFQVKATDSAGNTGPAASFGWMIDTSAPTVAITGSPANPSNSNAPSFGFTSEAGATFACQLDGAAFASCTSATAYSSVADGSHTFQVKATDTAGNIGRAASFSWMIDTTAPSASITASPTNPSNSNAPSFGFSSEPSATFLCALDGTAFASCSSAKSYGGVAGGSHIFQVKATDTAGNTGTAASFTWTIDTSAPSATITAGPTNPSNNASPSFAFTSSETPATVQCSLDGAAFATCTSPAAYSSLAQGAHTFQAKATDAAGNTGAAASFTWTVDTVAPGTTISTSPPNPSNSTSAAFAFTSTETPASFACSLDGAAFTTCTSSKSYTSLAQGSHNVQVKASDTAGNSDATPASFTWTVDSLAPNTTISASPTNPSSSTGATFAFTSTETPASFSCKLDGAAFAVCTSAKSYTGLAQGSHTFQVKASDTAGNTDATPASLTWTVDSIAPDTSISAGPTNPSNSTGATFSFTSTETPSYFTCALDGAAFGVCTSVKSYTGLAQGAHTFQVKASDAVGNTDATPASFSWTADTVAPDTSISASPTNPSSSTGATFSFTSTETPSTFTCSLDSAAFTTCSSPFVYTSLAQGSHAFQVKASDAAGNSGAAASFTWTVDTTAPETTITANPSNPSTSTSGGFSFASTETPASFTCALDGAAFTSCTSPVGYTSLAQGNHTLQVKAADAAGNTDATPAASPGRSTRSLPTRRPARHPATRAPRRARASPSARAKAARASSARSTALRSRLARARSPTRPSAREATRSRSRPPTRRATPTRRRRASPGRSTRSLRTRRSQEARPTRRRPRARASPSPRPRPARASSARWTPPRSARARARRTTRA